MGVGEVAPICSENHHGGRILALKCFSVAAIAPST